MEEPKPSNRRQTFVYADTTAQIPVRLLLDLTIKPLEKCLYCLYHSWSQEKNLRTGRPRMAVTQNMLANELGCTREWIGKMTQKLHDAGWLTKTKHGWQANEIELHIKPIRR